MNPDDSFNIEKTYIYANGQILAQHIISDTSDDRYFYLHDRLGSVRLLIDTDGNVKNKYTYQPFGEMLETSETIDNPFKFTGQFFDDEISQYYLRARMYDPHISRFTSRDPVRGKFEQPLTLHKYLYCENEPINRMDPLGLLYVPAGGPDYNWSTTQDIIGRANELVGTNFIEGPVEAFRLFGRGGEFDYKYTPFTFQITKNTTVEGSEFSNYLAGYTCYYNYGLAGELGARGAGHYWSLVESGRSDEPSSRYFISAGILKSMDDRFLKGGPRPSGAIFTFIYAKSQLMRFGYDRISEGRFERGGEMIKAEFGSNEWWNQITMLTEFWNAGPASYHW